ncbi:hypothetical protein M6C35_001895 [Vibrio metschnikovii]|nr:hypothetical protein [Vibrio metschnikovii]
MKITAYDILENIIHNELQTSIVDELGSGCFGDCYELENGFACKFTESLSEGIYAARLLGKDSPNIANIKTVILLSDQEKPRSRPNFIIIQELLDTMHPKLETATNAIHLIEDNCLSVYDHFDVEDLSEDVKSAMVDCPEYLNCLEEIQDALFFHQTAGNLAADAHSGNFGVKIVDGVPCIALFDQMNLQLEKKIKGNFQLEEHLQEEQLTDVILIDCAVIRARIMKNSLREEYSQGDELSSASAFNMV